MLEILLIIIVLLVLILPITVHAVEKQLEIFLFVMGVSAMTVSHFFSQGHCWNWHIVREALREPLVITAAVIVAGFLFHASRRVIAGVVGRLEAKLGPRFFAALMIIVAGLGSSVVTAIIAALVLVEVVSILKYDRAYETRLVVLGCFSIGLGAALTPIGEPLSTIVVAKLRGAPYHADFFFLLRTIGIYILPGILVLAAGAALMPPGKPAVFRDRGLHEPTAPDTLWSVGERGLRVYVFIMALIFLGAGFKPLIDKYLVLWSPATLYWVNTLSAVLDNATLAAAEISPAMALAQIEMALMGLLVAGGMLIPGNIPNIIAASRLGIRSGEWAGVGVPVGAVLMLAYFLLFGIFL